MRRWGPVAGLFLAASFVGIAGAQPGTARPFEREVLLRGARGSAAVGFEVHREGPVELRLGLRASELLQRHSSTLEVLVDGLPRRSLRLETVSRHRTGERWVRIGLGRLGRGRHVLEVRGRLRVEGDPCLELFEEQAWVAVLAGTRLEGLGRPEPQAPEGLRDIDALWAGEQVAVRWTSPAGETAAGRLALLEAHHLALRWGATLDGDPDDEDALDAWMLLGVLGDGGEPLAEELRQAPEDVVAVAHLEGPRLRLLGRSVNDVHKAIGQLQRRQLRQLCPPAAPCWLGATRLAEDVGDGDERAPPRWSLADAGFAQGWVADGYGKHTLRFLWRPSGRFGSSEPPEVHLWLRVPELAGGAEPLRISARLSTGELPLGSWELGADGSEGLVLLKARVMDHAGSEPLPLALEIRIRRPDAERCSAQDETGAWVVVSPRSGVVALHDVPRPGQTLGHFWGAGVRRPVLSGDLLRAEPRSLAVMLAPFAERQPSALWRFAPGPAAAGQVVVEASVFQAVEHSSGRWWFDRAGDLGVPVFSECGAEVPAAMKVDEGVLHVQAGACGGLPSVPGYQDNAAAAMVHFEGRWVAVGEAPEPSGDVAEGEPEIAPAQASQRASEEHSRLRLANAVWILLAGLLVLVALLHRWLRRGDVSQ